MQPSRHTRQVHHRNVVRVHFLLEEGHAAPLVVMDWIDGTPLDVWCNSVDGGRSWDEVRRIGLALVDALAALHDANVYHRDVRPANIFVNGENEPILMDMGVVELTADAEATLHTSVGDFIESVRYASPQFITGDAFEASDDVYSLGATLHLLVTARETFADVQRQAFGSTSHPDDARSSRRGASPISVPVVRPA